MVFGEERTILPNLPIIRKNHAIKIALDPISEKH
jgi:hypothetical protein